MHKVSDSVLEPFTFSIVYQSANHSLFKDIVILYNTKCIISQIMNWISTFLTR
jgi:hypothetical protein